ncbi:MAG: serine/threonine-protein kinase [Eubacteriales bacterium]|nr:serine/threonine-protein kinase [Eubacteriales bacterium]
MLEQGTLIDDKYKVIRRIGHGGMSNVYLVLNERANKLWALKEIRKDGGKDPRVTRQSLIVETKILRQLKQKHLPSIIDVIETEETYLILMDYIEGITLLQVLEERGAVNQEDAVKWSIQMCEVLDYLHTRKPPIIYRDMKPSNIMLKPDGDVVLIDFGAAREYRATKAGDTEWLGTRGYAAPEQFGGKGQTDARTDIYNLGATMYHLLTNHDPSLYPYEIYPIRKWNPALSSGLEAIVSKCTKQNPEERYSSCAELMYALKHYKEMESGYIKHRKRQVKLFAASCAAGILCMTGAFMTRSYATELKKENYSDYIRQGQLASDTESSIAAYKQAIALIPSNYQAYEELIRRIYLQDGTFSKAEAEEMVAILGEPVGRSVQTTEQVLKRNDRSYAAMAYQLGLAYFYYYEGVGNKPMSEPWFAIAKDSSELEESKRKRAERFYRIANHYMELLTVDRAGDSSVSYQQYWEDLAGLCEGNLVEEDNQKTAMVMYRELIYEVVMHANDLRKSGVSEESLEQVLSNIGEHLQSDFDTNKFSDDEQTEFDALKESLAEARRSVQIAYS